MMNMDILRRYQEEHPAPRPRWEPPPESGFFIRLVMRFSGSRATDTRQAAKILFIAACAAFILSVLVLFIGRKGSVHLPYAPVPVQGREFEDVNWPPAP